MIMISIMMMMIIEVYGNKFSKGHPSQEGYMGPTDKTRHTTPANARKLAARTREAFASLKRSLRIVQTVARGSVDASQ